jgi:POT family proton-dependent oligopeptide transporter
MKKMFAEQPRPFFMIFMLEIWERFGYYTVQGILALFFIRQLGLSEQQAFYTFGAFSALVYGMVAIGGYLGDKVLGTKRTILLGLITLTTGYGMLTFSDQHTVFYALGLICVANGLFKANPPNLLAKCYNENDHRLHGGFTLYYMSINLGSTFSLLVGPNIAAKYGYPYAFSLSFIGLALGIVNYIYQYHVVADINTPADERKIGMLSWGLIVAGIVGATFGSAYLLQHVSLAKTLAWCLTAVIVAIFFYYTLQEKGLTRMRMLIAFVLMVEAIVFFTLYMQMPTSMNLFAVANVHSSIFGYQFDAQSYQALNPIWIIVLSPVLAYCYRAIQHRHINFSIPYKFSVGMIACGVAFLTLYLARFFHDGQGMVSPFWLIASYFFQCVGELLVSALGVAMVAELVPVHIAGFVMGVWYLTSTVAGFTGAAVASMAAIPEGVAHGIPSLMIYTSVFAKIGLVTVSLGVIMYALSPVLNKYMALPVLSKPEKEDFTLKMVDVADPAMDV